MLTFCLVFFVFRVFICFPLVGFFPGTGGHFAHWHYWLVPFFPERRLSGRFGDSCEGFRVGYSFFRAVPRTLPSSSFPSVDCFRFRFKRGSKKQRARVTTRGSFLLFFSLCFFFSNPLPRFCPDGVPAPPRLGLVVFLSPARGPPGPFLCFFFFNHLGAIGPPRP